MSYTALQVENIGKQYTIGETVSKYDTLRDKIMETITHPFARDKQLKERETFWALNDVSFSVEQGEVVGIIGRNGAGKSTLLKILSRITTPTSGRIRLRGRVGTLLEVGTGFHPELTGRENTYMNGAILGMTRSEINKKFDEIVEFSGVERFIDTPVKRYSSGMYVRLAFAVAAHLETDILLVDEVLAVGDEKFQQKCLGKMSDVADAGRTVLFISHNVRAVQDLCPRTIVLNNGHVQVDSTTEYAIAQYLTNIYIEGDEISVSNILREKSEWGSKVKLKQANLLNADNEIITTLQMGQPFQVQVMFDFCEDVENVSVIVGIDTMFGNPVTTVASEEAQHFYSGQAGDTIKTVAHFDNLILNSGSYTLRIGLRTKDKGLDLVRHVNRFTVSDVRYPNALHYESLIGLVRYTPKWKDD